MNKKANRLINEKSPYLLQHAHNPVDWHPWGEGAFEKARSEDKPVFVSIGYSTCHWCHVMEEESFSDSDIAALLNENFLSIKVDREERPDIDGIYMTVCQLMTGTGGWPLTVMMTPDKKPFFAGTYFSKSSKYGKPGLSDILGKAADLWKRDRSGLLKSSDILTEKIRELYSDQPACDIGADIFEDAFSQLLNTYDEENGGFGHSPKFPAPHNLMFLLRYHKRTGNKEALIMAENTLVKMRKGGIYDQIGHGFHRYSTDPRWLVPHYEKMIYDQAMLALAYTEAWQTGKNPLFGKTVVETLDYVLREMTSQEGGFYSAQDADSEGEEGKFYLWTEEEVVNILGSDSERMLRLYNFEKGGNYAELPGNKKTGRNIPHLGPDSDDRGTEKLLERLFAKRQTRIKPFVDDKILTDWNGLMIAAMSRAGASFSQKRFIDAAKNAADFMIERMLGDNQCLMHRYRGGEAAIEGFLDDYAFAAWGLFELYEATFEYKYLKKALQITEHMTEKFCDPNGGGMFFTPKNMQDGILRKKEIFDGAVPSGNSVAFLVLAKAWRFTLNPEHEKTAGNLLRAFSDTVSKSPANFTHFLCSLDYFLGPSFQIVISGLKDDTDTIKKADAIRKEFIPNKLVAFNDNSCGAQDMPEIEDLLRGKGDKGGKAAVYICRDNVCGEPQTEVSAILELLGIKGV